MFLRWSWPKNWSMYADMTTPAPTVPPTLSPTSLTVVSDGKCNVVGDWVHSPNIPQIRSRIWRSCGRFRHRELVGLLSIGLGHVPRHCCDVRLPFAFGHQLQHKPQGMDLCAEVVSAVNVPHVSTVSRESFDLWRTGLLTLSLLASVERSKVFVRVDVRSYGDRLGRRQTS